jgi:hypothetical protein
MRIAVCNPAYLRKQQGKNDQDAKGHAATHGYGQLFQW